MASRAALRRLGGAEVGAVEALVEADRVDRATELGGDRLEQAGVVLVEGVERGVLEVDHSPGPGGGLDRDGELGADVVGVVVAR